MSETYPTLKSDIAAITGDLVALRHFLHAHPELSNAESATAARVAEQLAPLGLDSVRTEVGGYGIVAEIRGSKPGPMIALRADMDGLPIMERNEFDYCSTNPGVMHACGHDGHTTVLVGVARILAARRHEIAGTVRLLFQPAEENVEGALRMCADGAIDGVSAVYGLHGWPDLEVGQIGVLAGPMMAGVDDFDIVVHGASGHAAYPHRTVDPIVIGSRIVEALQALVGRETDPFDNAVVSVTKFTAGTAYNIIPGSATLSGTIRTLSRATRERLPQRLKAVAEGIAYAAGARAEVELFVGSPPVVNDAAATVTVASAGLAALGAENVITLAHPSMGGEDFAVYLDHCPGSFFRLGLGDVSNLHTPTFNFTDAAIPAGVEVLCRIALG